MNEEPKRPLTKEQLGDHYGVRPRTVDRWMKERGIPYMKLGKVVRFDLEDVAKHLKEYYTVVNQ